MRTPHPVIGGAHDVTWRNGERRGLHIIPNAHLFAGRLADVPAYGLTMGMATILRSRALFLIATGAAKAAIVARALRGPITTRVPASLLQAHPRVVVFLDRAAASRLTR